MHCFASCYFQVTSFVLPFFFFLVSAFFVTGIFTLLVSHDFIYPFSYRQAIPLLACFSYFYYTHSAYKYEHIWLSLWDKNYTEKDWFSILPPMAYETRQFPTLFAKYILTNFYFCHYEGLRSRQAISQCGFHLYFPDK